MNRQEFAKFCRLKEYGWIFIELNPETNDGITCQLLIGGKLWTDLKMQEEGYIFTHNDKNKIFESAAYTLKKDRPSFRLI